MSESHKSLLFIVQVVVSQAQGNISMWKERALSLTSIVPTHDAVLQETLGTLEKLSCQLAVLAELQSPALKHRHWNAIFKDQTPLPFVVIPTLSNALSLT